MREELLVRLENSCSCVSACENGSLLTSIDRSSYSYVSTGKSGTAVRIRTGTTSLRELSAKQLLQRKDVMS